MTDWFGTGDEDLDADDGSESEDGSDAAGDGETGEPEKLSAEQTEAILKGIAESGGDLGKLAADLLDIRRERAEQAAEQARMQAEFDALAESTPAEMLSELIEQAEIAQANGDDSDEAQEAFNKLSGIKDVLRAQIRADQAAGDADYLQRLEQQLRQEIVDEEEVAERLEEAKDSLQLVHGESDVDVVESHPLWQQAQWEWHKRKGEREAAQRIVDDRFNENPLVGWETLYENTRAEQDAYIATVLGGER